jgi:transcription antitermination factor NusG
LQTASWYALHTRSRQEKSVARDLQHRGFETYLPLVTQIHHWSDRRKAVEVPLFSGYTFARLTPTPEEVLHVKRIPGVVAIVGVGPAGTAIEPEQIESVRILLAGKHPFENHPFLQFGQRVRICNGALRGLEGILVASKGENKIVVSIELIQRSLAITLDNYDIEAA